VVRAAAQMCGIAQQRTKLKWANEMMIVPIMRATRVYDEYGNHHPSAASVNE
jgi:hypothetical protein